MTFQCAGVKKPLASVSCMCAAGFKVVYDDEGLCIEHKKTGVRTPILKRKICWLDVFFVGNEK